MKSQKTTNKVKLHHLLKYGRNNEKVITGIAAFQKLRLRIYTKSRPTYVLNGLGIAIISTSLTVLRDRQQARRWCRWRR